MKRIIVLAMTSVVACLGTMSKVVVKLPRVENMTAPLAVETASPRFSWQLDADEKNVVQRGYEIEVRSQGKMLWHEKNTASDRQLWIPYGGKPLKSGQQCTWRVRSITNKGTTEWSEEQPFGIGLLTENRWGGRWIGWEQMEKGEHTDTFTRLAARYLREVFTVEKPVRRATAYVAGVGLHELHVNGQALNDFVMMPMPTDYRKTILYNTYDITPLIGKKNCVGVVLGNGRYFAMRQDKPYKNTTFGLPKLRLNIVIEHEDGSTKRIVSDEKWRVSTQGPIRANNEYDGEEYDARLEMDGWDTPEYDDSQWKNARRTAIPTARLRAQMAPGMKAVPLGCVPTVQKTGRGYVLDFGQNMAGWVEFMPRAAKGDTITLRFAEKTNPDGTLYTDNLRDARSQDTYIVGDNPRPWHPVFVTHGFRYVEVTGQKDMRAEDFRAFVVSDDMHFAGRLLCSDTILNAVLRNAWWGIRSNYKGMPIDCPQRDERMPWLGDRVAGALGESFLFDTHALYAKWTRDIREAQREDGSIPDVAPAFWNYYSDNMTWPAALPMSCEMLWEQFGDLQPVRDSYASIVKWMEYMHANYADADGIITRDRYGDWCMPPESLELVHSEDPARITDGALISTAYYVKISRLLAKFARLQGLQAEAKRWDAEADRTAEAFNRRFLKEDHYDNNTVTANVLPLAFDIVPESSREAVGKHIVDKIVRDGGGHISCGVIGLQWIQHELSRMGRSDVAFLLATQDTYPSYGYMAAQGATTIWELWNGNTANPSMNSGNHVMLLGDLISWYYHELAGTRPDKPGYKRIALRPDFSIEGLDWVNASYRTPYGVVESCWRKDLERVEWDVAVPQGTTARVWLPGRRRPLRVRAGEHHFTAFLPRPKRIAEASFLYEKASFPQCHASTVAQTPEGDLVAAYFGGSYEKCPDVCIWVSRKPKGSMTWSEPQLVEDGVQPDGTPVACWNPVLFQIPGGELLLFYKVAPTIQGWVGYLRRSRDGGRTWSEAERLPDGLLGAIKDKPVMLSDGRIIAPSSTEDGVWRIHFEISDDGGRSWRKVGPVAQPEGFQCIQPSILIHRDGTLQAVCRTKNGFVGTTWSRDRGQTWSEVELLDVPHNQSGLDAVTLRDGSFAMVHNDVGPYPGTTKGPRTPLSVSRSKDGIHWSHFLTLEDSPVGEYSYPAVIQDQDGALDITYTWRRRRVKFVKVKL